MSTTVMTFEVFINDPFVQTWGGMFLGILVIWWFLEVTANW